MSPTGADLRRTLTLVVVVLTVVIGISSCGGSDSNADDEQIRAAIARTQKAFAAGNLRAVCASLTKDGQRQIGQLGHDIIGAPPEPCPPELALVADGIKQNGGLAQALRPKVVSIEVDGNRAIALVEFDRRGRGAVPLAKERGEWKVDALYGGLPPDQREDTY
jgi:hypothetical protein